MILVDTNVLLRSAQPSHSQYAVAKDALMTARVRGYIPCVVPQVIYEYWVVATRPITENGLGLTPAEAETDVVQIIEQFQLFRDERAILDRWQHLVAKYSVQGKRAHDARLIAAMERHGISHLVTFNDQHFAPFPGVTVVHSENVVDLPAR